MSTKLPIWMRTLHRWGTVITFLPFLIILITGLLLQWKKEAAWIQPATQRGTGEVPVLSFEEILEAARAAEAAGLQTWTDIDRLDVRPEKGVVKVRGKNGWEVQVDAQTGAVLQVAQRRSDLIEALHDGSWFHDRVKLWVFFPVALVMLVLWGTGLYLFYLPYKRRWTRRAQPPSRRPTAGTRRASLPAVSPKS